MAVQSDRGVPLSTLCPKFLHTNSTSHTWPFSAIAELIDNAYDPDVRAKQFWIDQTVIDGQECLTFMDNGNGLNLETIHKMLSFGFSDKVAVKGLQPIGIYGNGFKSGAMRLGRDVIVFSKSKKASCIGMLSQSYLEKTGAKQIVVPIVSFEHTETNFRVGEEQQASLQDILRYSPFKTETRLLTEVNAIRPPFSQGSTGTRILIWNLRRSSTGATEFDFKTDRYDIRLPLDANEVKSYIPESENSLRAYCSILYLKPRMQINIRGHKVKTQLISKSLAYIRRDKYRPSFLANKLVPITFGYNPKSKDNCGIMMYHKNRLIKAYKRVGCQLKANVKGLGVIGVIECDFLEPTHNKQSFSDTDKYRKTINNLASKLEDYWNEMAYRRKQESPNNTIPVEDDTKRPDQNWAQCDECLKWRKLPDGINCDKLPEKWFCYLNPDPQFRYCQVQEEPEDSDDEHTYSKTYKQHEREEKKNQEMERKRIEEERKRQEKERIAALHKQNESLRRQQLKLKRQLRQTIDVALVQSPSTSDTPRRKGNSETAGAKSITPRSTNGSGAGFRHSIGSPLIISDVRTLSTRRTPPDTSESTPKRRRISRFQSGTTETPTPGNRTEPSPSMPTSPRNDTHNTTDDDDVVILEVASTPLPKKPDFDLTKVKNEEEESDSGLLMDCFDDDDDDDAVGVASKENAPGSSSTASATVGLLTSAALPSGLSSSTTQTEVPKIKDEEQEEQNRKQRTVECQTEKGKSTVNSIPNGNAQSSDVATHGCRVEQTDVKLQGTGETHTEGRQTLAIGVAHEEAAGPSCTDAHNISTSHLPNMNVVQKQQDQLLELMEATAQERDVLKDRVVQLTGQLHSTQTRLQTRLQELSQTNVTECTHQASQTEEAEEGQNYKSLFEKARLRVNELIMDKEALLKTAETNPSTVLCERKEIKQEIDEIALQVDRLVRELAQRNKERDELRSQLDCLEEEKAKLSSQCEQLKLSLQSSHTEGGCSTSQTDRNSAAQAVPQEARRTEASGIASSSGTSRSLIELRQNVGRLLSFFVPALDLTQVNYECDVIDEILVQSLSDDEFVMRLRKKAENE